MKKLFEDYQINDIVIKGKNRYLVDRKEIRSKYYKIPNQTFYTKILYLRALDSSENRVARVNSNGSIEFLWHSELKYRKTKGEGRRIYEKW